MTYTTDNARILISVRSRHACMDAYTHTCTQVDTHLCMHVCVCEYLCVHKHAYTFACVYIYACVALYTCKCVHIYMSVRAFCTHVYVYRSPSNSCSSRVMLKDCGLNHHFFWFGLFCLFFPKKEYRKFSINVI